VSAAGRALPALVKREGGNGFEIGGVGAETIAVYSSRAA
jgi:hypothetical protein